MHKINYRKEWDSEGYCYCQCVTVTKKEWILAMEYIAKNKDKDYNLLSKIKQNNNVYFANITQCRYIANVLNLYGEKKFRAHVNTRFKVC